MHSNERTAAWQPQDGTTNSGTASIHTSGQHHTSWMAIDIAVCSSNEMLRMSQTDIGKSQNSTEGLEDPSKYR